MQPPNPIHPPSDRRSLQPISSSDPHGRSCWVAWEFIIKTNDNKNNNNDSNEWGLFLNLRAVFFADVNGLFSFSNSLCFYISSCVILDSSCDTSLLLLLLLLSLKHLVSLVPPLWTHTFSPRGSSQLDKYPCSSFFSPHRRFISLFFDFTSLVHPAIDRYCSP